MTDKPDPTAEHIDAVARAIHAASWSWLNPHNAVHIADELLTSTDPDVYAALAANLPTAVMVKALRERGLGIWRHMDENDERREDW